MRHALSISSVSLEKQEKRQVSRAGCNHPFIKPARLFLPRITAPKTEHSSQLPTLIAGLSPILLASCLGLRDGRVSSDKDVVVSVPGALRGVELGGRVSNREMHPNSAT